MRRELVVIGASAGGIDALRTILAALPADFPAAIGAVLHMASNSPGMLDAILARAGPLPARTVRSREPITPGRVFVPTPDRHLVVEPGALRATQGPRENRFRPAIDPLFRSAAQVYGPRAIGVILTGGLDDGVAGLRAIKQLGGVAVVQDPDEAVEPSMPREAILHVRVDHVVALAAIPKLLIKLVTENIAERGGYKVPERMEIEVNLAREEAGLEAGGDRLGEPSTYACPECHGVLRRLEEGGRVRFRCHTGHAYSSESLMGEVDVAIETALWNSLRALQEKVMLVRDLARHARARGEARIAHELDQRADDALARSDGLRQAGLQRPDEGGASVTRAAD